MGNITDANKDNIPSKHTQSEGYNPNQDTPEALKAERERIFGKENTEYLESSASQIGDALFIRLNEIKEEGGDVEGYLELVRDLSNSSMNRLTSVNLDPEPFDVAIKGATALLTAEKVISRGYEEGAKGMVDALKSRYSIT